MPERTCNFRIGSAASINGIFKGLKSRVQVGYGTGRNHGHLLAGKWPLAKTLRYHSEKEQQQILLIGCSVRDYKQVVAAVLFSYHYPLENASPTQHSLTCPLHKEGTVIPWSQLSTTPASNIRATKAHLVFHNLTYKKPKHFSSMITSISCPYFIQLLLSLVTIVFFPPYTFSTKY